MAELEKKLYEFNRYIWNHVKTPLLEGFDSPPQISEEIAQNIIGIAVCARKKDTDGINDLIDEGMDDFGEEYILRILQLTGSTRSKIITDLKAQAAGGSIPSKLGNLPRSPAWPVARKYLAVNMSFVFGEMGPRLTPEVLDMISRATWPGFIRQEKAKRGGHASEQKLACALRDCEIPFAPEEKSDNPLCRDVQINGESFDIVVPDDESPRIGWIPVF